jgi:hypothetical protein
MAAVEHIKYPDPKGGGNSTSNISTRRPSNQHPQPQGLLQNGTQRAMSPPVSSDTDDGRHGVSGGGSRVKAPNGGMQPFPNQPAANPNGKRPPTRPPRDEQGANDLAEVRTGMSDVEGAQNLRQQMKSPEQMVRSKSPTNMSRAMSPPNGTSTAQNVATIAMARGVIGARSPSPGGGNPSDPFVYGATAPKSLNGRTSPVVGRPGSSGHIAADLIRDMRTKDAELETLRRRETWMRAALSRASKAGFSYNDIQSDDGDEMRHEPESNDARKLLDLAFRLKQERAALQVILILFINAFELTYSPDYFVGARKNGHRSDCGG